MAQQLDRAGLKNLDPMFFWRNVLDGGGKVLPQVVAICSTIEEQEQVAKMAWTEKANFVIESDGEFTLGSLSMNCYTRPKDLYTIDERNKMWKKVDVLYYKGDDLMEILPAMLSGVTVVDNLDDVAKFLDQPQEPLTRINNFEKAKEKLENLLRSC